MGFLTGALDVGLSALFERKPDVPNFQWVDLAQQQLDTAKGNLGVLPQTEELGGQVNSFMRGERAKTLAGIPGLSDIEALQLSNLKSWLRGELSPDVASQVQRHANSQAFAGGYGNTNVAGSMGANLHARDIATTSQQIAQNAMGLANQFNQSEYAMRATPEFNPSSMFINPMQAAQFNASQQNQQWNRDWLANRVAAQPEPWQQTLMTDVNAMDLGSLFGSKVSNAASAYGESKAASAGASGGGGMSY